MSGLEGDKGAAREAQQARSWIGHDVKGIDGSTLGKLEHVYLSHETGQPTWGVVKTGLLGRKRRYVPLGNAAPDDATVRIPATRKQVSAAPDLAAEAELRPEAEQQLQKHYLGIAAGGTATAAGTTATPRRQGMMRVTRSKGAITGLLLVALGVWGALIPFVGPYFGYAYTPAAPWTFTWGRFWLEILPGAATILGGLMLAASANRVIASLGGYLATAAGGWFVVGPTLSLLLEGSPAIGQPVGEPLFQALIQLGFFYGIGALITALAAGALGRLSVRGVRDVKATEQY